MKQAVVTIKYDEEKLNAVKQYMGKKDADFDAELKEVLGKMYEKYVPQATRENLDDKIAREGAAKPARPRRQMEESHARNQTGQELE